MISYNLFLSKKFTGRKEKDSFLHFITLFSITGIAIGVISLILVIGVMSGFSKDLKRKIIGANPTITVEGRPFIRNYRKLMEEIKNNVDEVEGISPFISTQVIYRSDKYIIGGILKGIDEEKEVDVTNISKFIKEGSMSNLKGKIIVGSELAKELEVKVGDRVEVIGGLIPRERSFIVGGIVEYGVYSFDVSMGFVSLPDLQQFLRIGDMVYGIGIKTEDIYNSEKIAEKIRNLTMNEYKVSTWIEKNKILFSALALEKRAMAIILSLIILVASFNIASTLMISVYRKIKEIGILKAIGLSSKEIRKIFFYQGIIIGIKGLLIGLSIGSFLAYLVRKYQFIKLPEFVYDISRLPIELSIFDYLWICFSVILIVSFASIYPAIRASKLNPAEAIRNE